MSAMHEGSPHSNELSPKAFHELELEALRGREGQPAREALVAVLGALTTSAAERGAEFGVEGDTAERVVMYGEREVTVTYIVDAEGNPKSLIGARLNGEGQIEINAADFK